MRRNLPTMIRRLRRRPTLPIEPPPSVNGHAHIVALRAGDLVVPTGGADAGAPAAATVNTPRQAVERARGWLEEAWTSDASLAQLEGDLHRAGLPRRTTSLLLAERRAVDRIRAAGLDPSTVRADVDALLALEPWTTAPAPKTANQPGPEPAPPHRTSCAPAAPGCPAERCTGVASG